MSLSLSSSGCEIAEAEFRVAALVLALVLVLELELELELPGMVVLLLHTELEPRCEAVARNPTLETGREALAVVPPVGEENMVRHTRFPFR